MLSKKRVLDSFIHDGFLWNLKPKLIINKGTYKDMIVDPSPNQEHQGPPKLQQSVIIFRRFFDKMTDFYEILNLSLLSSKEHNKNQIMDPRPSQEP